MSAGGAAFPHCFEVSQHPQWSESQGMSLRDYFAAKALAGITSTTPDSQNYTTVPEMAAEWAYQFADAMLAEREKGGRS